MKHRYKQQEENRNRGITKIKFKTKVVWKVKFLFTWLGCDPLSIPSYVQPSRGGIAWKSE
jgi:hypothetical protein